MPYNGSGVFVRVYSWQTDKANGIKIRADRMDGEDDGFATGLSTCITKDGQTTVTANIPMAAFKITGLGAGTARTDAANISQLQDNGVTYFTTGGTGSAYTLTPSPAITALSAGQAWNIRINTVSIGTAPTLQVSGLAVGTIINADQSVLNDGQLKTLGIYRVQYDGTNYQLVNTAAGSPLGLSVGGTQATAFTMAANTRYRLNTTAGGFTVGTQGSPAVGDLQSLTKYGTAGSIYLSGTVNGVTGFTIPQDFEGNLLLEYTGATRGLV